ncbi:MAG TPA: hypothetical protein VMK13_18345 [Streptosporangiaceae bacterium]|nr:hypothetical protein [Streptosporangiaceae bacterium]
MHAGRPGGREGGGLTLKDLTVLTPPLLVCLAFLIAVGAFLRHEMAAKRQRDDNALSGDISEDGGITEQADRDPSAQRERRDVPDQFDGERPSG